jgi:hypothetical protein
MIQKCTTEIKRKSTRGAVDSKLKKNDLRIFNSNKHYYIDLL